MRLLRILLLIFSFLFAIQLLGVAFGMIGGNYAEYILKATSNPFIGLFIGLLSTAILQSSSTTTSMVVVAVAAGSIPLESAIPIVMGANIGTTLTSTIVSMSYVTKTTEFKQAISAGLIHDIFNILICVVLFPLEMNYGVLSKLSRTLASALSFSGSTEAVSDKFLIYRLLHDLASTMVNWMGPYLMLILAIVLLFATVKLISRLLYRRLIGNAQSRFESLAFKNTFKSFTWGFLLTSVIQSSSLTTSLIVPLVATGKVQLKRAFQFIVGANLGTTITALLAALFKSEAAVSLAIAHFLFNMFGVVLFIAIPYMSGIPIYLAEKLGDISMRFKITAFAYILVVFFILPFTLIYFSK